MTDDKHNGTIGQAMGLAMGMGVAEASPVDPEAWARGLYARALSQWTLDQLHARAHGLLVPSARRGEGVLGLPFAASGPLGGNGGATPFAFDLASMLRWQGAKRAA